MSMLKTVTLRTNITRRIIPDISKFSTMSASNNSVREAKSKLRLQIKTKLKEISQADKIKQTYIVTRRLIQHPDFQNSKRIAIYVNMKNEVGTYDILKEAFDTQKQVYIPLTIGDTMKMVKLNAYEELKSMPKHKWGIIQPSEDEDREDCLQTGGVDYVVVPGVAFSSLGLRLGHGKGFYDKFLAKNDEIRGSRCITTGLAFNEQIVEDIPTNDYDFRLTWVVYPEMCSLSSKYDEMPTDFTPPPEPFTI